MLSLAVLATAAFPPISASSDIQLIGRFATISISSNFSYSVLSDDGLPWLSGGGVFLQCGGFGWSTFNGSLVGTGPLSVFDASDARYGPYTCVQQAFVVSSTHDASAAAQCGIIASIRYYPSSEAFEFYSSFPSAGVPSTATAPLPTADGGWPASPWPLATAFPAFSSAAPLGFMTTEGNMLSDNFVWAPTSFLSSNSGFAGGLAGGPVMLFNSSSGAAAVLSPLTHAKSVFLTPWADPTLPKPPPPRNVSGVYHEVTHGCMSPITASISGSSVVTVTFLNGDVRAPQFWETANCTLVQPSGPASCIDGTYWTVSGQPFATKNWTASIALDFSSVNISDGAVWLRSNVDDSLGLAAGVSGLVGSLPPNFEQASLL